MSIKLADAFIEVILDYAKAEKDAQGMDKTIGGITAGTVAKLGAGMLATGASITGTIGVATSKAAEFGKGLAAVSTLGIKDLAALDSGVRDVAVTYGIDLNDAIGATYEALGAGIPEDAAIMVMEQAARGATAGQGTLNDALDLGTSVMNAWNIKGKDANETARNMENIMGQAATAADKGKTTFAQMATSIGQVAPVMSAAGVGTDEFFAAIAALTATGLPTSSAMTQLQQAVSNTIKPSQQAKEMAESLGLEFGAEALAAKGLSGFLDSVKEATGGNVEQMGVLFGSVEALGATISLTGNQAELFKSTLDDMGNATKNLANMSDEFIKNNPGHAFSIAKAAAQELFILIGRTAIPMLTFLVNLITPIIRFISDFIEKHPIISSIIGTLTVLLGGLLTVVGGLLLAFAGLMPAIGALSGMGGFAGLTAALQGLIPAAGAAAGAGGLGAITASLLAAGAAALPLIALIGIIATTFVMTAPTIASTAMAYWDLAASNQAVNDKTAEYIDLLNRQGMALDKDAIMRMNHADQQAAINNAVIASREQAAAREIQLLTGTEATRQQIHIAELARVGLEISAKEAAALAAQGTTQAEIEAMMRKGQAEQQLAQQSSATKAQAAAENQQFEIQGRTDKTETIGVFQWAADKEAEMLALASRLKNADHLERRRIMADLARMEEEKAAAERAWAMENQALTSQEIAGHKFMVAQKEEADRRFIEQTQANGMAQKQQLYTDLNHEAASIKVHGDAITRQRAYEAEQRKKLAEDAKQTESSLEDKLGKEKLDNLNKTLQAIQDHSGLEKSSAEQVSQFKKTLLNGDLDASMQFWNQMREQTNQGLITNLEQYKSFSAQMKAEAQALRKELAYAMNPAQTGSPSLNMEMAAGFQQTQQILAANLSHAIQNLAVFRQAAAATIGSLGATIIGNPSARPTPSDVGHTPGTTPITGAGLSGEGAASPMSVSAPVSISITGGVPSNAEAESFGKKIGDTVLKRIAQGLAAQSKNHARGRGVRSPGMNRNPIIPT